MADVFSKAKRSEVMSRIRSRGNRDTELALAKLLRANGITGWRRHVKVLGLKAKVQRFTVKPDFVFRQERLALFVDGCFWHGCPRHATQPKNNAAFWLAKLSGNRTRDALVTRTLRGAGWRVVRIWECALQRATKKPAQQARLLRQILRALEFQERIKINRI